MERARRVQRTRVAIGFTGKLHELEKRLVRLHIEHTRLTCWTKTLRHHVHAECRARIARRAGQQRATQRRLLQWCCGTVALSETDFEGKLLYKGARIACAWKAL